MYPVEEEMDELHHTVLHLEKEYGQWDLPEDNYWEQSYNGY